MADITYHVVTDIPVDTVVELYEAGGWWKEDPKGRQLIPRMVKGSFCFMVAREEARVVGMGRAISDGHSDAYIQDVVVLKSHRGKGIGGGLVKRLADHCVAQGLVWIGLIGEPGTTSFYEKLGFAPLKNYQPMLYQRKPS